MIFDFRLQVFHTVAKRLSFTRAAEELFITQPAVTKHIRSLEQYFSTKLFERQGNSIRLTASGRMLYSYSHKLEQLYGNMEQEMHALTGLQKGILHIGTSTTVAQYVLPPALAAFREKYDQVTLHVTTANTEHIEHALLNGTLDLGLVEGGSRNRQIKYTTFCNDEIVPVVKAEHPLGRKKKITSDDLKSIPVIMREAGSGTQEAVNLALKKAGLKTAQLNIALHLDSTESIKSYVLHSESLAFVSRYALKDTAHLFKILKVQGMHITRPFSLIYPQGEASSLTKLFTKFISAYNFR